VSELANTSCEACRVGAPLLSANELTRLLSDIPDWQVKDVDGIQQLQRVFIFPNFIQAMAFANKVGLLAETQGHHPALLVEWGRVTVDWWSHKIKGLHKNDVVMAAKTDLAFISDVTDG